MKKVIAVIVFAISINIIGGYSQTIRWSKGKDLEFLKGEKLLKVVILYDSMTFDNGKKEMEYQSEVAKAYNAEVPGKGDKYLERWEREKMMDGGVFIDRWMKDFTGSMKKMHIKAGPKVEGAKYILKVYPLTVTTGKAGIVVRGAPAYSDFRIEFVEAANPNKVAGSVFLYQVMGTLVGNDLDFSFIGRFKNCFWFGGITLGREMIKIYKGK